jgi:hypothetical protein
MDMADAPTPTGSQPSGGFRFLELSVEIRLMKTPNFYIARTRSNLCMILVETTRMPLYVIGRHFGPVILAS